MENHEDSSTILQKALSGDEKAWDELFVVLWPVIYGAVAARVANTHLNGQIEDMSQSILVKLLDDNAKRLRLFSPEKGMLERFVARVARNYTIDHLRNPSNTVSHADIADFTESLGAVEDPLPMVEQWEIDAAMGTLSEREREVVELHYLNHLEVMEIAQKLDLTTSTIRSEKSRALKKLRRFFGRAEKSLQRAAAFTRIYE